MVTEKDRYLFDCRGYLVLREALSAEEVDELNRLIDTSDVPDPEPAEPRRRIVGFLEWADAFRRLMDHPRVFPYLQEWLGPRLRLDHAYGIYSAPGTPQHDLHLGGTPYEPSCYYHVRNGRIFSGLTVVTWALTDHPAGQGSFACIPGSHKSEFPCPDEFARFEENPDIVANVGLEAGDALIFTEALTHGAYPWTAPFDRRALLLKYTPGHMTWSSHAPWSEELREHCTPTQRALLEPPYVFNVDERALRKTVDEAQHA